MRFYVLAQGEKASDENGRVILDVKQQGKLPVPMMFASKDESDVTKHTHTHTHTHTIICTGHSLTPDVRFRCLVAEISRSVCDRGRATGDSVQGAVAERRRHARLCVRFEYARSPDTERLTDAFRLNVVVFVCGFVFLDHVFVLVFV
jgi:hypothetical protein